MSRTISEPAAQARLTELDKQQNEFCLALQAFLRQNCPSVEKAKAWIDGWVNKQDQFFPNLPGFEKRCASRKWMAAFLSLVLEEKEVKGMDTLNLPRYFETKFGDELLAACEYK